MRYDPEHGDFEKLTGRTNRKRYPLEMDKRWLNSRVVKKRETTRWQETARENEINEGIKKSGKREERENRGVFTLRLKEGFIKELKGKAKFMRD